MKHIATVEEKVIASARISRPNKSNGIIKDDNGYYKVILGYFNTYNSAGVYYLVPDPNKFLESDQLLGKRLREGSLYLEYQHPQKDPNEDNSSNKYKLRLLKIDLDRVCGHIKELAFIDTGKREPGWDYNIIRVEGWIKPSGPMGKYLEEALENPDENVKFSIRTISKLEIVGSVMVYRVLIISTWDVVDDHGMAGSSQWDAATTESRNYNNICLDGCDVKSVEKLVETLESSNCEDGKCVINTLRKEFNELRRDIKPYLDW